MRPSIFLSPRTLRAATIVRPYGEARDLLETLESLGSVVTTLSTIGTTTVRTGR